MRDVAEVVFGPLVIVVAFCAYRMWRDNEASSAQIAGVFAGLAALAAVAADRAFPAAIEGFIVGVAWAVYRKRKAPHG